MAEALIPVYEGRLSRLPGLMAQMTTDHSGYAWVRLRGGLHVGFHWKTEFPPARKRPVWRLCRFGAPVSDVELGTFRRHVVLPDALYSAVPDVKPGWPRNFTLIGPSQQDGATG